MADRGPGVGEHSSARHYLATSGRILQALTFYPTGAIVAAPTTDSSELPGNFPQADSHIGLNAARAIRTAEDTHRPLDAGDGDAR